MTIEEQLLKNVDKSDKFFDRAISIDQKRLQRSINALENRIIQDVASLATDNGNLVSPRVNLKQAQKIHKKLTTMFDETYGVAVRETVAGYDSAANLVLDNFNDLDVAMHFTSFDKTMLKALGNQKVLEFAALGVQAQERITQAMYNSVAAELPMSALIDEIKGALVGSVSATGVPLANYANLYARDAMMNYYNTVHLEKANQAGLDHFLFTGNVMATSRSFCIHRAGKVYSEEEIKSWNFNWAGKRGPAMTYRGGWNCRHHWHAVDPEWVPEGEIAVQKWEDLDLEKRLASLEARGAVGPDEKLFKKRLNQLRFNLKSGKFNPDTFPDSNLGRMWYNIPIDDRAKLMNSWEAAGIDVPSAMYETLVVDMPPSSFVKIPGTVVSEPIPPAVPTPPKPPKPPKTPPIPEVEVATVQTPTAAEAVPVTAEGEGLAWNSLDVSQKKDMNNLGYNIKIGKKYNPNSKAAKTWNQLSYETQQMKIGQWQSSGFTLPPNLPIKGDFVAAAIIPESAVTSQAAAVKWEYKTLEEASEQFYKDFKFLKGSITTGYTEAESLQILNDLGKHWDEMLQRHPGMKKILDEFAEEVKVGDFINIINGTETGAGAAGSYSDQNHIMNLAGQLSKKSHQLNVGKGGWSVGSDFYSVSRHEFGHYLDNVIRQYQEWPSKTSIRGLGWNHQDEFRALYKKHQENWADLLGKYSAQDKYEGFAEVFGAYTSPEYQAGMLPKDIEDYMKKLIGGLEEIKPVVEEVAEVALGRFADPAHDAIFDEMYAYYRSQALELEAIQREIREKCNHILDILGDWQGSTQGSAPSALKLKAELMEARDDLKFFARKGRDLDLDRLRMSANAISDEEYIRLRAIVNEYYDRIGKKSFTLWRGTGNRTGAMYRGMINDMKDQYDKDEWKKIKVVLREPSLNGWSTRGGTAKSFGVNGGGITARTKVMLDDIFISDELWPKYRHIGETEFVVFRSEAQEYTLNEMFSGHAAEVAKKTAQTEAAAAKVVSTAETVPQAIKTAIAKLPSVVGDEAEIAQALSLYVQSIPGWKGLDKDAIIEKLQKKLKGIAKAVDEGQEVYMFPGVKAPSEITKGMVEDLITTLEGMDDDLVVMGIEQGAAIPEMYMGSPVDAMDAINEYLFTSTAADAAVAAGEEIGAALNYDLFKDKANELAIDIKSKVLKKNMNLYPGAKPLPNVIINKEQAQSLVYKHLKSIENMIMVNEYDLTAFLSYEMEILAAQADPVFMGYVIDNSMVNFFTATFQAVIDTLTYDKKVSLIAQVKATKVGYY